MDKCHFNIFFSLFMKNLMFVTLSLIFFCCDILPPQEIEFDKEAFDREWAAWEKQGIVDYSVIQELVFDSWDSGDVYIVVENNSIIKKEVLDEWSLHLLDDNLEYLPGVFKTVKTFSVWYSWVNDMYNLALARIDANEQSGIILKIIYNKEFHYPENIYLKHIFHGSSNLTGSGGSIVVNFAEFIIMSVLNVTING